MSEHFIYGINPVREHLKSIPDGKLYFMSGKLGAKLKELEQKARAKEWKIIFLERSEFSAKFDSFDHQGVVLEVEQEYSFIINERDFYDTFDENENTVLLLDGIQDVGNLGAILRSALLFGVTYIILPKNNSAPINEVVLKRSAGAIDHLKIVYVTNLNRTMDFLKERGFWIYGADMDGKPLAKHSFAQKSAIVMGSEEKGMRALVRKNCDEIVSIETNQKIDSLNVSVSCAVILYSRYKAL